MAYINGKKVLSVVKFKNGEQDNNLIVFSTDYSRNSLTIKESNGVITIKGTASANIDFDIPFNQITCNGETYKCALSTNDTFNFDKMAIYFRNNGSTNVVAFDGGSPTLEKTQVITGTIAKLHLYILRDYAFDLTFKPVVEKITE